jgi:hypothetical protein
MGGWVGWVHQGATQGKFKQKKKKKNLATLTAREEQVGLNSLITFC